MVNISLCDYKSETCIHTKATGRHANLISVGILITGIACLAFVLYKVTNP